MLLGASTSFKLQLVYSAAAAVDLEVSGSVVVVSNASPPVVDGTNTLPFTLASLTNTAGATADLVSGIASTKSRIIDCCIRNNSANDNSVTIRRTDGTNNVLNEKMNLLAGECAVYNGAIWLHKDTNGAIYPSVGNAATQAEMEAGTATTKYVTPQGVNWHPGVCKAWAKHTVSAGVPQMTKTWNVTSVTDSAACRVAPVIATDFSSADYAVVYGFECNTTTYSATTTALIPTIRNATLAAGGFTIDLVEIDIGQTTDPASWHWLAFGDQ